MRCSIQGCPGVYEQREISQLVRHHQRTVVIDHVPAEVCTICGDVLLTLETARHIEELLAAEIPPTKSVPLYEYA